MQIITLLIMSLGLNLTLQALDASFTNQILASIGLGFLWAYLGRETRQKAEKKDE